MSDQVLIGATLPQFTDDRQRFVDGVHRAQEAGLDSVWVFDHLWPLSGSKDRPIIESWTALAWVAEETDDVSVGTLVTRSSLRNPRVLAQMAATVADIAADRLIVGIGSGDDKSRAENEAFGLPYWSGDERLEQLEETVALVREHLPSGAKLWVGGRSDDAIEIAVRHADGWNGWGGSPAAFARDAAGVAEYAAGRPVETTWGGVVKAGDPDALAGQLSSFAAAGARHLVCTFSEPWRSEVYEQLGREVKPRVRAGSV